VLTLDIAVAVAVDIAIRLRLFHVRVQSRFARPWRGFVVENGNNSGNEIDGLHANRIIVNAPFYYAVMLWGLKDASIKGIEVDQGGVTGNVVGGARVPGWDARVRFGSQSSSTVECKNVDVGYIRTNGAVVTEANASYLNIGRVDCAGGKLQETEDSHIDSWIANGALLLTDEAGNSFGVLGCKRCMVDTVIVNGHNSTAPAVSFTEAGTVDNVDNSVGSLSVRGTQTNVADVSIRQNDGLQIGRVVCKAPVGTGDGFHFDFDAAYAPQNNIRVGTIYSTGHTTNDVLVESDSAESITVDDINFDAVKTIGTVGRTGSFTWTTGTASQAVSNPHVLSTSKITITPKDADAGVVMNGKGFYITQTAGSFTIFTGDGTNTGGNSDWDYLVFNGV